MSLDEHDDDEELTPEEVEAAERKAKDDAAADRVWRDEPTPEESDHYARMWWGGRLG